MGGMTGFEYKGALLQEKFLFVLGWREALKIFLRCKLAKLHPYDKFLSETQYHPPDSELVFAHKLHSLMVQSQDPLTNVFSLSQQPAVARSVWPANTFSVFSL